MLYLLLGVARAAAVAEVVATAGCCACREVAANDDGEEQKIIHHSVTSSIKRRQTGGQLASVISKSESKARVKVPKYSSARWARGTLTSTRSAIPRLAVRDYPLVSHSERFYDVLLCKVCAI